MAMRLLMAVALLATLDSAAIAQVSDPGEIIVTGSRVDLSDDGAAIPAIGLRRTADFAVRQVTVAGDTRDAARRRTEIYEAVRGAIALAGRRGDIELATGEIVVEPLTLDNYRDLPLKDDRRPDAERTSFFVKTRLVTGTGGGKAALDRIEAFIKAIPPVGRAQAEASGDLTLSVVRPDQYRGPIIDLVAADARETAARVGGDYAVEAKGLDRPVEWTRASLTEVFLYLPYSYTVRAKGN
jgi:hypothetical protein